MCCLFSVLCQHHQDEGRKFAYHNRHSAVTKLCLVFGALLLNLSLVSVADAQIGYTRYLSELRIQELHNIAIRLEHSIDTDKFACDGYFDYVCGRNRPLFSIMGHLPDINELIQLLTELQEDPEQFEAKQKLMDFFISCNSLKNLEDCYRETFEYFKPLFGYLISKNYLDNSSHELQFFLELLKDFIKVAKQTGNYHQGSILPSLADLQENYKNPQRFFRSGDLNIEYEPLKIYRESYYHNIQNLEIFRKRNSTFEMNAHKTVLDWTLYLYQSRNKPASYYYATFNVHLWMSAFNITVRNYEAKRVAEIGECLKLPQFVNVLEEARFLAIVYMISFNKAYNDYQVWTKATERNQHTSDQENEILKQYQLSNDKIFFTLYGQNFCEFGKDLAENVFFLGIKHSKEFYRTYSCGYQTERNDNCL